MRSVIRLFFAVSIIIGLLATAAAAVAGAYFYIRLTRDLPKIERLSDYRPKAVTSIYSDDGSLIAEVFEERRYPVTFDEIPKIVKDAFIAAEDANFYSHPGIDFVSILRALWVNLRSKDTRQGASTITQQIVKSLLLTREKTYERKAKEAILSYRLEKALSKDEIFSIYLNEIFLGSGSYGVRAAAKVHFRKELPDLTIAEAAYLAGLPQRPSHLTNPKHFKEAMNRQRYVLRQMLENRMITKEQYDEAIEQEIVIHPPDGQTIYAAPYYAGHVIRMLGDLFAQVGNGQTAENPGGYSIQTAVNLRAYELAERSLQRTLRELDKRQGWRGPVTQARPDAQADTVKKVSREAIVPFTIYLGKVDSVDRKSGRAAIQVGEVAGVVDLRKAKWAARQILADGRTVFGKPEDVLKPGALVEVSLQEAGAPSDTGEGEGTADAADRASDAPDAPLVFKLDQTPVVEGAFAVSNALTGEVKAVIGGYDYQRSQFNRATQGLLQPGSAFKPFIYLAALEHLKYTPATIVPDSPISMMGGDNKVWAPQNFDHKFLGPITLRTALQRSRNVVSVYLLQRMGVQRGIQSAKRLGLTTQVPPNMSIALGTPEVHLIEMVRAYGAFAAEGWLAESIFVKSIRDRDGTIVYERFPKQEKVIADEDAFIMANMMKGVVERGTAQLIKKLNRPVAGKTGTTNDQNDAWFIGYTPEWVAGVWTGFDVKRTLGRFETGGKAAAPAFLYFMQEFLKGTPVMDFNIPDGVIPVPISLETGRLVDASASGAFIEYFKSGTEPRTTVREIELPQDYLTSDEF